MTHPLLARLRRDRTGATAVEFAILAPVMIVALLSLMEVSYQAYVSAVLQGAVNEAGRNSTLEDAGGKLADIDTRVKAQVLTVTRGATFSSDRKSYYSFSDVSTPEPFNDANKNGVRDANECYEDLNGNGGFDLDRGKSGQGGADDIVTYTMTVKYPLLFPLTKFLGWNSLRTIKATTVLRNQPYGAQAKPSAVCAL